MKATTALTLALACAFTGACSSSSSPETSDDAGTHDSATHDAGAHDTGIADVSTGDGYDGPPPPVFTLDAGITWTALYRDYFGNDTQPNTPGCSSGDCHGKATDTGYLSSGYLCPPGDKEACYKSITSQADGGPELIMADASFDADPLSSVLCADNDAGTYIGNGQMPQDPMTGGCKYYFRPVDMERLRLWVQAGYPDN